MAASQLHDLKFPGESQAYRAARNELLREEIALRQHIEDVAALRRRLPQGGPLKEDYAFEEIVDGQVRQTKFSELFVGDKSSLIVYGFMFGPDWEFPCRMCNSILDGLDGNIQHLSQRANFAVIAKAPIERVQAWADQRGWRRLRVLSSEKNTYNIDYFAEDKDGEQWPMCNVFVKHADGIRHFHGSELHYAPVEGHPRHMDLMWPLWNLLDLTPEGRGTDWLPDLSYG